MALLRSARFRRMLSYLVLLCPFFLIITFLILPYDSSIVLFFRWQRQTLVSTLISNKPTFSNTSMWYPVEMPDIGLIIKTGYGTRDKLAARLATMDEETLQADNLVVVADYTVSDARQEPHSGSKVPVYDVLATLLGLGYGNSTRMLEYKSLQVAVEKDLKGVPRNINSWDLDVMKHIPGIELGYKMMPGRHWYILSDDDTFIVMESVLAILENLDPFLPHYLGAPIGSFNSRFAHGGSALILSQGAMQRLFIQNPDIVSWAKNEALDAPLGDKVIAQALLKVGVYIKEEYGIHFNGEPPTKTRIRGDRFCLTLATFHKVDVDEMPDTQRIFGNLTEPLYWIDIWTMLQEQILADGQPVSTFPKMRLGWDYVGALDDSVTERKGVVSAGDCMELCVEKGPACLGWVWKDDVCYRAPWLIVGRETKGATSGVNVQIVNKLAACD